MINQLKIPLSKVGDLQQRDVRESKEDKMLNDYFRTCTVVSRGHEASSIGDRSPFRMAELFGGDWEDYNFRFVAQVAGCSLKCYYCYVDNLTEDWNIGIRDLARVFSEFRLWYHANYNRDMRVFHLMGGNPGAYADRWPELRDELNFHGHADVILHSNCLLIEAEMGIQPWKYLGLRKFYLSGCLKGTNQENFIANTGYDGYKIAMEELEFYKSHDNFSLSLIGYDEEDLPRIYSIFPKERIETRSIKGYFANRDRMLGDCVIARNIVDSSVLDTHKRFCHICQRLVMEKEMRK